MLNGKRVAILVAEGFEQSEMVEPRKALEQAGAETEIVSPAQGEVQGWKHFEKADRFNVDVPVGEADADDYDALLLPGGVANPDQLRTIFVTVDPKRDTRDVLANYLSPFPGTIGLVGTDEQTTAVKASFGAASETTELGADGFYLVNHTASVFLINKDGNFEGTIAYGEPTETAVAKIKKLIAS